MNRIGLTKSKFNRKVEEIARKQYNKDLMMGLASTIKMHRNKAVHKAYEEYFIIDHEMYSGMSEYDYLVARAVEQGRSTIEYQGRTVKIS